MGRVNALTIIASVTDAKTFRDAANIKLVSHPMGFGASSFCAHPNFSVTTSVESGEPLPAAGGFNKFCLESFYE